MARLICWLALTARLLGALFRLKLDLPMASAPSPRPESPKPLTGQGSITAPSPAPVGGGDVAELLIPEQPPWVQDRVRDCYRPSKGLDRSTIRYVVIHHCSLEKYAPSPIKDAILNAAEMSARFKDRALGTGGLMPYHGLVTTNGMVEQAIPLSRRGSHAVGANWCGLSWCVVGGEEPASEWQIEALARVVTLLVIYCRGSEAMVVGHSEVPGGSNDPTKKCPWPSVNMGELREMVKQRLPCDLDLWPASRADMMCRRAGLVLDCKW
jgi:N-acetylmuramoyl-L-alanine amidase